MRKYIIIDSNKNYAKKLYNALTNNDRNFVEGNIIFPLSGGLATLSEIIADRINELAGIGEVDVNILINAEGILEGGCRQQQQLVEQAFWLRCKHNLKNPIIFYSLQSVNQLLKTKPENFILLSPGIYHLQQPLDIEKIQNSRFKPIGEKDNLKPYLKPKINLEQTRHRYANYAGMTLMLLTAKEIYGYNNINVILGKQSRNNEKFKGFYSFWDSLEYSILANYYNLETAIETSNNQKKELKQKNHKKILLIDDLAEEGWTSILSQMIYGSNIDENLEFLKIQYKQENNKRLLDLKSTQEILKSHIGTHKPHLILLDLRLNDEEGKTELEKLGGYQLLKYIKDKFKGLPVIMFTASSNSDTTKKLIDAGADYVWTKPGIDEGLDTDEIIERYRRLFRYVRSVFSKFDESIKLESSNDLEESRLKIFQKIEFIRYRADLSDLRNGIHYFNDFTDIFVDTNFVVFDVKTLCNIYKLAQICGKTAHKICVEGTDFQISAPKVVFDNFVIDETIHHSKKIVANKKYFWKMGVVAYDLVRGIFQDGLARTELNSFDETSEPIHLLQRTEYLPYKDAADFEIIRDIKLILSGEEFRLKRSFEYEPKIWRDEFKFAKYLTEQPKVLLLTNDGKLKGKMEEEFSKLPVPKGSLEIIRSHDFGRTNEINFNDIIETIDL